MKQKIVFIIDKASLKFATNSSISDLSNYSEKKNKISFGLGPSSKKILTFNKQVETEKGSHHDLNLKHVKSQGT